MVDEVHNRPEGTARSAFNRNREHFIAGVDFLELTADVIRTESISDVFAPRTPKGIILFETGYLMLTKPFNDPLSWQVQRELVSSYFRQQQARKRRIQTVLTFRQREARPSMAADRGPGSPASPVYDR